MKTIHRPSVNQFGNVISWYDFDYESQCGDTQENYNVIDEINLRVVGKRFAQQTQQINCVMSFLDDAKYPSVEPCVDSAKEC